MQVITSPAPPMVAGATESARARRRPRREWPPRPPVPAAEVMDAPTRMAEIHRLHGHALTGFALRLTLNDRAAAEDLVQETMLRTWRSINRLPTDDLAALRPWLFTVARNHAIDVARARQSRPGEVRGTDLSWIADATDAVDRVVTATTVRRALLTLSPEHRIVLVELYLRDQMAAQVAARLGVPEGTVKSRAHYALRALRAALGAQAG